MKSQLLCSYPSDEMLWTYWNNDPSWGADMRAYHNSEVIMFFFLWWSTQLICICHTEYIVALLGRQNCGIYQLSRHIIWLRCLRHVFSISSHLLNSWIMSLLTANYWYISSTTTIVTTFRQGTDTYKLGGGDMFLGYILLHLLCGYSLWYMLRYFPW